MENKKRFFFFNWLDKLLKLEQSEQHVTNIKKKAIDKVDNVTVILHRAGVLQQRVMKKTTTFYIGKAIGTIK